MEPRPTIVADRPPLNLAARRWAAERIAATFRDDPDALVLDLETTGLDDDARIVDVAVVTLDGAIVLDRLVNPEAPIPPEASRVHGLTDALVAAVPTFRDLYPVLADAIGGRPVWVWNAEYDREVIRNECYRIGRPMIVADWRCAMKVYSRWDGTPSRNGRGFAWHGLADACRRFGIDPGCHRALADALATLDVLRAMVGAEGD